MFRAFGTGFQPSFCVSIRYLGLCPRLVWGRALGADAGDRATPAAKTKDSHPLLITPHDSPATGYVFAFMALDDPL